MVLPYQRGLRSYSLYLTKSQRGSLDSGLHTAIHTATGGAFGPPYLLFVAPMYARVATGALSASPSIRFLAGYSLCADYRTLNSCAQIARL